MFIGNPPLFYSHATCPSLHIECVFPKCLERVLFVQLASFLLVFRGGFPLSLSGTPMNACRPDRSPSLRVLPLPPWLQSSRSALPPSPMAHLGLLWGATGPPSTQEVVVLFRGCFSSISCLVELSPPSGRAPLELEWSLCPAARQPHTVSLDK